MAAPDGLLIVDKPQGWTSHDVVAWTRRLARTRRVGHAGTLDPMATGVLVLGIGRATRLLGYLARTDKGYDATIRLGQATVTDDAEGDLLASRDPSGVTQAAVIAATSALKGRLQQVPSAVSAIKVKGERAYTRVRAGEDVTLPARPVTVSEFAVGELRFGQGTVDLDVHVECSTGTYVRALARDLGAALGVGGHLTALRRTRVGGFDVREAHSPDGLAQLPSELLPVISLDVVARHQFTWCVVAEEDVAGVRNGRSLNQRLPAADEPSVEPAESAHPHEAVRGPDVFASDAPVELADPAEAAEGGEPVASVEAAAGVGSGPVAVFSPAGEFLALYEQRGRVAKAVAVFAPAT